MPSSFYRQTCTSFNASQTLQNYPRKNSRYYLLNRTLICVIIPLYQVFKVNQLSNSKVSSIKALTSSNHEASDELHSTRTLKR